MATAVEEAGEVEITVETVLVQLDNVETVNSVTAEADLQQQQRTGYRPDYSKEKNVQAGNELSSIVPKSSHTSKKPPLPPTHSKNVFGRLCVCV